MTDWMRQPEPPWSQDREEDQRFQRILNFTLVCSLALGVVAPYVPLPLQPLSAPPDLPARRVRLLEKVSPPRLEQTQVATATPDSEPEASAARAAEPDPKRPTVASTGVLAMRGALATLQDRSPPGLAEPLRYQAETGRVVSQPTLLSEGITDIGGNIQLRVTREDMLGSTELPANPGSETLSRVSPRESPGGDRVLAVSASQRTEEDIQEVLDRHKGEMFNLYNQALRVNPALRGELMLSLSIDSAGRVINCAIISSNLGVASLESDLVNLVKGLSFGSIPEAGVVVTRVPIEFFPQ
jgi:hypothetical protein